MGSTTDYKFEGWAAHDASSIEGNMKWQEIKPKGWEETDVDIKITHCGMCGSDLHFLNNGWVSRVVVVTRHLPFLSDHRVATTFRRTQN